MARFIDQTSSWTFYNAVGLETESPSCSECFTLSRQLIKPWCDSFRFATKLTLVQLSDLLYVIHVAWNRITQNGWKRKTTATSCKNCINFLRAAKGQQINYANSCVEECAISTITSLTFRHRASCILGQTFRYSPENAFYIFNQQIYFIIWYLLDRASLI